MKKITSLFFILILITSCKKTDKKVTETSDKTEQINYKNQPPQLESMPKENNDATEDIGAPPIVDYFICYKNNKNPKMLIWISFTNKGKAIELKYKGQKDTIPLEFEKKESTKGGAYPIVYEYYNEILDNKINGKYLLTHSGNWDYVEYTRGKDGKIFKFTIVHDANPYGKEPCF